MIKLYDSNQHTHINLLDEYNKILISTSFLNWKNKLNVSNEMQLI